MVDKVESKLDLHRESIVECMAYRCVNTSG